MNRRAILLATSMDQTRIRLATFDDLPTLLRFEQGVIEAERPYDRTLKREHTHYYDLEGMITAPHIELLVAEIEHEVIGSGYARMESAKPYLQHTQHAYLGFMFVEPSHRGKGVNRKIITALQAWAYAQKVTELRLEVYVDNISAIKAYEKLGFTKLIVAMRWNPHEN